MARHEFNIQILKWSTSSLEKNFPGTHKVVRRIIGSVLLETESNQVVCS